MRIERKFAAFYLLMLSSCAEVGGPTPADYAATPVGASGQLQLGANRLAVRQLMQEVHFEHGSSALNGPLPASLAALAEEGVSEACIFVPAGDPSRPSRVVAISRLLRGLGVASTRIAARTDASLEANTYRIEATYGEVVPPACPDWSDSANHSFSNLPFRQMGCATVSNVGQMLADPQDLQRGHGDSTPDPVRGSQAIQNYYSGMSGGSSSTTTSGNAAASASANGAAASGAASGGGASGAAAQ